MRDDQETPGPDHDDAPDAVGGVVQPLRVDRSAVRSVDIGDADLVERVRGGDDEAFAELFRRHQGAAVALARSLAEVNVADDIVAESFEKLLLRIRGGGGPASAFRPYLLQTVRTVAVDTSRRTRRLVVADDPEGVSGTLPPINDDGLVDAVHEKTTLARAFAALPERWQTYLWMSFVEGSDRQEIATVLGVNAGGVSALGYRAREGLRRAYLDAHLQHAPTARCAEIWPLLSGSVRGGLSPVQQRHVDEHVATCDYCAAALAELTAVNTGLGAMIAPLVLGAAAPAYLAGIGSGAAAGAGGAGAGGAGAAAGGTAGGTGATAAKVSLLGLGKMSAAGVAVVAGTSTVTLVGLLAIVAAPLASEPSAGPLPGIVTTTSDGPVKAREQRQSSGAPSTLVLPAGNPTGLVDPTTGATIPTGGGDPTSGPTSDGGPTAEPSGGPTAEPTGGPTGPTGGPTGPTGGPTATGVPTGAPTTAGPTAAPTEPPTVVITPSTGTTPADPTPTVAPTPVNGRVGSMAVAAQDWTATSVHVTVPVTLTGDAADLRITLRVLGLNKFRAHAGSAYGAWGCTALTPMAGSGEGKVGVVQCDLPAAKPTDTLALGIDIGYAGTGSVAAQLAVLAPAEDADPGDNGSSTDLP